MSEKLRPCPFCGGEAKAICESFHRSIGAAWMKCRDCGCIGPMCSTEAEAVTAWNTRPEDALIEALEGIAGISAGGPFLSAEIAHKANWLALNRCREIARAALSKAKGGA